jgi:hypothetical protein
VLLLGLTGQHFGRRRGVRERNGEIGLGLGPTEVERDSVVGVRCRLGGVDPRRSRRLLLLPPPRPTVMHVRCAGTTRHHGPWERRSSCRPSWSCWSGGSPPAPLGHGLGRWQPRAGAGSGRSRLRCEALGATRTQLHLCRFRGGAAAAGTSSVVVCRSCCGGGGLLMVQLVHCPLEHPCSNLSVGAEYGPDTNQ